METAKSEDPRVAFWIGSLRVGGYITSVARVAQVLANRGIQVDLILSRNDGPFAHLVTEPTRIIDLHLSRAKFGRGIIRVIRYLISEQPDAMFVPSGAGYLVAAFARVTGRKTKVLIWVRSTENYRKLAHMVEMSSRNVAGKAWRHAVRLFYLASERALVNTAHGIVTNSHAAADEFVRKHRLDRKAVYVIHNACITEEFTDEYTNMRGNRVREKDRPVILSVGRLTAVKNLDVMLHAFRVLRDQRNVRLVIVGDGPSRSILESLISDLNLVDDVDMLGFQPNPFPYFTNADLFALSSKTEPFGNVLVEAMACGCPVVSTDCVGPREILADGRYGPLVPIGDHIALAAAMAEVLDNPPDSETLWRRAMEFHADRIASLYREAAGM